MSARFHRSSREQRLARQRRDAWYAREKNMWGRFRGIYQGDSLEQWAGSFLSVGRWRKTRPFGCPDGRNCRVCGARNWLPRRLRLPVRDRRKLSRD